MDGSFFGGFADSTALSCFCFSAATSGLGTSAGAGSSCFVSGLGGRAAGGGALPSVVSAGGTGGFSFGLRLFAFSASTGFVGAVSVIPEGGTVALGGAVSFGLRLSALSESAAFG